MKIDFKEITTAWFNKVIHSPLQKELADDRFKLCLECPSKKEILNDKVWSFICEECGCPLKAKVYTSNTYQSKSGSCPLGKWKDVENLYLEKLKVKKTVI